MKIAVTGGTGYVGGFIVDRLLADGHEVRLMVRRPGTADGLDAETHLCELAPDADFTAFLDGADALIHAALDHRPGRYRGGEGDDLDSYLRSNLTGSLALLTAARNSGLARAVILSSRAVYGRQPPGAALTEDMAVAPDSHYGAAKAALEAFASSLAFQDGWPVCALRPTGVYGLAPEIERSKWFDLVGDLLAGRPVAARGGTEVHGRDVAAAVSLLLDAPAGTIAGQAFNCSDIYVTTRDIAAIVEGRSGQKVEPPGEPEDAGRFNIMDCSKLAMLGLAFGGDDLFRRTVAALTDHHLQAE